MQHFVSSFPSPVIQCLAHGISLLMDSIQLRSCPLYFSSSFPSLYCVSSLQSSSAWTCTSSNSACYFLFQRFHLLVFFIFFFCLAFFKHYSSVIIYFCSSFQALHSSVSDSYFSNEAYNISSEHITEHSVWCLHAKCNAVTHFRFPAFIIHPPNPF